MNKIIVNSASLALALVALFLATLYTSEYGGAAALPVIALQFISAVLAINLAAAIITPLFKGVFNKSTSGHHFG